MMAIISTCYTKTNHCCSHTACRAKVHDQQCGFTPCSFSSVVHVYCTSCTQYYKSVMISTILWFIDLVSTHYSAITLVNPDHHAEFGPPDKSKNFCSSSTKKQVQCTATKAQKRQHHYVDSDSNTISLSQTIKKNAPTQCAAFAGIGQREEVRYNDGVWYKGTLVNFDITSGQWKVELIMTMR